jgi:hypothetical protein
MISTALGPFIGAALASALNGYAAMFIALAAIAGVAAAVATFSSVRTSPG